jgi:hypothetical protein
LNKSHESGLLCLALNLRGNYFSFSPFSMMKAVGLPYIAPILLRYSPSVLNFWGLLSWRDIEFCPLLFLYVLRWPYQPLSFILLMWCLAHIDLHTLNHPCIPGISPTLSWCIIFLMCYWTWLAGILLRTFASVFYGGTDRNL